MTTQITLTSGHACRGFALLLAAACGTGCATEPEPIIDESTCLPQEVFRIERVDLPASNTEAAELGRDLGGEKGRDNWLGSVNVTLSQMFGISFGELASDRLSADVTWMAGVRRCGDRVVVNLTNGEPNRDLLQLIGEASGVPLVARARGFDAATLPLGLMFDPYGTAAPGFLPSLTGLVELDDAATGDELHGTLALALPFAEAREVVLAAMTPYVLEQVEAGDATLLGYFDTAPKDGRVTAEEIRDSAVTASLLASDLEVDLTPAVSFGLRIHATRVR